MTTKWLVMAMLVGLSVACVPRGGGGGGGDDDGGPADGRIDPDDGVSPADMFIDPDDGVPPPDMFVDPDDGVPPPDMAPAPDGDRPRDMAPQPDGAECDPETCNGAGDDCDGVVDEGQDVAPCVTDTPGRCADGLEQCVGGAPLCVPRLDPQDEQCNDEDDDCDGAVDEGDVCDPCAGIDCAPGELCSDGVCGLIDPGCGDYAEVADPTRNLAAGENGSACDRAGGDLPVGEWLRFVPPAGERMAEEAPEDDICGTDAPGWLMGGHPQTGEGVVERTVCFSWRDNPCRWEAQVEVLDCGDFVLYRVPPVPICNLRYCAE